jgi:quinol monooxygenase YgiN
LSSGVFVDAEDGDRLLLIEEWSDQQSLSRRLRGEELKVLCAALESATEPPGIWFDSLENSQGIEFISECQS